MANVLPNMKTLMPPPQHWYFNRQNSSWTQVIRPPGVPFYPFKPQPPQIFPQWTPEVQHNSGYQQTATQNNQYTHHAQQKPAQSEAKPEIKNSTPFVPLQAQKKSRNSSAKQSDGKAKEETQPAKHNLQAAAQQKKKGVPAKVRSRDHRFYSIKTKQKRECCDRFRRQKLKPWLPPPRNRSLRRTVPTQYKARRARRSLGSRGSPRNSVSRKTGATARIPLKGVRRMCK